jgi:hypothetical protein
LSGGSSPTVLAAWLGPTAEHESWRRAESVVNAARFLPGMPPAHLAGGSPPASSPPPPAAGFKPPVFALRKGKLVLAGVRLTVGTLSCPQGCELRTPKTTALKVGRKTHSAKLIGPTSLKEGASGDLKLVVPAKLVRILAAKGAGTARLVFTVISAGRTTAFSKSVALRGKHRR